MHHLRTTLDVPDRNTLDALLLRAQELKRQRPARRLSPTLSGRVVGMLFERPSTRTRVAFEAGIKILDGTCIVLQGRDIWLHDFEGQTGEALRDTARVLGSMVDALVVRPDGPHAVVEEFARHASVPVINAGSDFDHPCQALTDLFTIYERREHPMATTWAFVGDNLAMAHGYLGLAARTGISLRLALPDSVKLDARLLAEAKKAATVVVGHDPRAAVTGADVVATCAWHGPVAEGFRLDAALCGLAAEDHTVLHPLPARRGAEITDDVLEGMHSVAFHQAENRLVVQQALLERLLGTGPR